LDYIIYIRRNNAFFFIFQLGPIKLIELKGPIVLKITYDSGIERRLNVIAAPKESLYQAIIVIHTKNLHINYYLRLSQFTDFVNKCNSLLKTLQKENNIPL
jgi:hypothetical protein